MPSIAAPIVANASADSPRTGFFIDPVSSAKPARWHMALRATSELKRSRKINVSRPGSALSNSLQRKEISSCIKISSGKLGNANILFGSWVTDSPAEEIKMPTDVTNAIPMRIAPGTLRRKRATVTTRPKTESVVALFLRSPIVIKSGASAAVTSPAFLTPMNAINRPIPTVSEYRRAGGNAFNSICRIPKTVSNKKMTPDQKTSPRALCQGIP